MREVIAGQLWIGNTFDVDDIRSVLDAGVQAIVDLALQETPKKMPRDMLYLRFPLNEGGGNSPDTIRIALESVASLLRREIPTLVFCSAGMSRSPSVAAFGLALAQQRDPSDCIGQVLGDGPRDVSSVLWKSLATAYDEIVADA